MEIKGKFIGVSNPIETKKDINQLWTRPITKDRLEKRAKLQQIAKEVYENFDRLA